MRRCISRQQHRLPKNQCSALPFCQYARHRLTSDSSILDFQVWDFPAQIDFHDITDIDAIFAPVGAIIFIIDAQDEYFDAIERLITTIIFVQQTYPSIHVEVFVHKIDGLSEDFRSDIFRDIQQHVQDELTDRNHENVDVAFHQTSIYDHSIFEAISKVVQKLIVQLPALESLLNTLCSASRIEKAYLFDVLSKIYIASDTSAGDLTAYETCSDYIDVIVDVSEIYGWDRPAEETAAKEEYGNEEAESLITMEKRGTGYLYLREVNKYLALVCIMGDDEPGEKKAAIDYNVSRFQESLRDVFNDA